MNLREQGLRFVAVGVWNTLVGYGVFVACLLLLGERHYVAALVLAWVFAVVHNFALYRRFVFRVEGSLVKDFGRFAFVHSGTFGVNLVALPVLVHLGAPVLPAQALVIVAVIVGSFVAHRYFSFRRVDERH